MKKYLSILILTVFIVPSVLFASINNNLKYGSVGPQVIELQEFLIDKGFLNFQATGNFFTLTKKAVVSYQSSVGLPATGYVGPMTREKINLELVVDDSSEIQETGATNTPTVVPSTDTATLQKQLELLRQQVAQLFEQQKVQTEQTQQTNQTLTQIQQNTTPVQVVVPTITPESLATSLKLSFPDTNESYPEFIGANCGVLKVKVSVLDQFDDPMKGQLVAMSTSDFQDSGYTNSASGTNATDWSTGFNYRTQTRTGSILLTIKSGNFVATSSVYVRDVLTPDNISYWGNGIDKNYRGDPNVWTYNGLIFNPTTRVC